MQIKKSLLVLLFLACQQVAFSQVENLRVEVGRGQHTIQDVLDSIKSQQDITVAYAIQLDRHVHLEQTSYTLQNLLSTLFPDTQYEMQWKEDKVLVRRKVGEMFARIHGYVFDISSGERLFGATILDRNTGQGTVSNKYGFFSIETPSSNVELQVQYLGFETEITGFTIQGDTTMNLFLAPKDFYLETVVVSTDKLEDKIVGTTPVSEFQMEFIQKMPSLGGEADVLKYIQILPGVKTVGEGSSGYFVRGGNFDQNLILLDEAPVYNASHALGFFSVFNPDAIKDIKFYKNTISARYGGRLSSLLDVGMREGSNKDWRITGGIGLISSRLTLQGPVIEERSSFMISARRTYADLIWQTLSSDESTKSTTLYFYDLNAKFNYMLNERNTLYLSGFFGQDVNEITTQQYGVNWGNRTATFRWNHVYSSNLFSNLSLLYSNYQYNLNLDGRNIPVDWKSKIEDVTIKLEFDWYLNNRHFIQTGFHTTYHDISPGETGVADGQYLNLSKSNALEHAIYGSDEIRIGDRLILEAGLRFSAFQNLGEATLYQFDESALPVDSIFHPSGSVYHTEMALEPRISASYTLKPGFSLKTSYNRVVQYMYLISNTMMPFTTFDVWLTSNSQNQPQFVDHFNLGLYKYFPTKGVGLTVDFFYKQLYNQVDAADHAYLLLNRYIDGQLRSGNGEAYGTEITLEKSTGKFRGFLSYTYSRARRTISGINNGNTYNAPYDKPHAISISLAADVTKRSVLGLNWQYTTGGATTLPTETYVSGNRTVPIYSGRNESRLPAFHRLDLSWTLKRRKEDVKNKSYWVFGVYNAYFRKNASTLFVSQELDNEGVSVVNPAIQKAYKYWFFSIVPSITYNFDF